ncbi:four helix bundle protein [Candidatus Peregrinibacteria bacterium]|nr:four helix bundle protein [Candidatus Peregrinibacteria bacterium]
MPIQSYRDLIVWQKSMDLVTLVYKLTKDFPKDELYGLTSQMRRSAASIPSNISEGSRRSTRKEFRRFLCIAYSSGAELETQLEIAIRLEYGNLVFIQEAQNLLTEIMKMLNKMTYSLKPAVSVNYSLPTTH